MNFFTFSEVEGKDNRATSLESLAFALDLYRSRQKHAEAPYGVGPKAYANWLAALDDKPRLIEEARDTEAAAIEEIEVLLATM